ncbi:hypothetical protein ACJW30_12G165800 [Castanea mollissima]
MLFPYGVWNFFYVPTRKLLKQQNLPAFLRHCCSDSICSSHPNRTNLRIESKAVKIILKKCFRISDFIRAISEAPLTFAYPSHKDPWMKTRFPSKYWLGSFDTADKSSADLLISLEFSK